MHSTAVVALRSPHYSGRRGCAHAPPQVVLHGFRPTVSIWLISFHFYLYRKPMYLFVGPLTHVGLFLCGHVPAPSLYMYIYSLHSNYYNYLERPVYKLSTQTCRKVAARGADV